MKKILFISFLVYSFFGCQKLNDELDKASNRLDQLEGQTISSINEQITSLNQTISTLQSVQAAFQSEISSLKKDIAELETAMQTLRNERSRLLSEIEKLEEDAASLRDDISDASSDINNNIYSLKDAITKQLNELRSRVSSIEAQINSLQQLDSKLRAEVELLTNKDTAIQKSITALQSYVDKEIKEFSDAAAATYMTIEHYNSVIEQLSSLKTEIATWHTEIHSAIDSAIAEVSNSLDYIEERTAAMEQLVESVVNGVESLIYIPIHEDGRATLYFSNEQGVITNSYAVLDFAVHPASAATELATLWNKVLSVKAQYVTSTIDRESLSITSVSANDGILTVTIDGSTLKENVYNQELSVSVRLEITNNLNTITSKYVSLKRYDIGNITIPDAVFKAYLVENFDTNKDNEISRSEAAAILTIDVSGLNIKSLAGIDYCINLKSLNCSNTKVQHLNINELKNLTTLNCSDTPINELEIVSLENFITLDCSGSQICLLNISNTPLRRLNCSNTHISGFDTYSLIRLEYLNCSATPIEQLEIAPLVNLKELDCSNTQIQDFTCHNLPKLTTLNISNCKILTFIDCFNCGLQSLDVSNNTSLVKLYCNDNRLPFINVATNTALQEFDVSNNLLSTLNVSNNTALIYLCVSNNPEISMVDVKYNTALEVLIASGLAITDIDLTANTTLKGAELFNVNLSPTKKLNITGLGIVYIKKTPYSKGKMMSVEEASKSWGLYDTTTGATNRDNGMKNVNTMKNKGHFKSSPAFTWCGDYGTDWYLPAFNELKTIYNNKSTINSTLSANCKTILGTSDYLSSTESGSFTAYGIDFSTGIQWPAIKYESNRVRAILEF